MHEQPWPSGNALDSDQRGPGFEAHRRPLVTSGMASGPKIHVPELKSSQRHPPSPKELGEMEVKLRELA